MTLQHYHAAKSRHPGMLLLFRQGDFYELYGEDAEVAVKLLGLCLTQRTDKDSRDKVFMASIAQHALEDYLRQLLKAGHRVAVCNQVEEARMGKAAEKIQRTLFDESEE